MHMDEMKGMLTGIQHIGIPTEDMKATKEFYKKLGFEVAFETVNKGDAVCFLKLGNLVIEAYESDTVAHAYGAIEHVAIDVKDVRAVYEWICGMGMNTLKDQVNFLPFWENGVEYFTIEGPNKEKVEFSQFL